MFNEIEQAMVARLTAKLPDGTRVLQQSELDESPDQRQKCPFVAVVYDGFTPGEFVPPGGRVQKINLDWYVVVGTQSAKGAGKNIKARDLNGPLAKQVLQALLGYSVSPGQYLRLRQSPGPEYEDGYCFLPIGFSVAATFTGTA